MNKKVMIALLFVFIWMSFIFIMSSKPSNESDNASRTIIIYLIEKYDYITNADASLIEWHHSQEFISRANGIFRKCSHAFVYFVLSILVLNFLFKLHRFKIKGMILINLIICILYACTDEFHQTYVMGRSGELRDVLIDTGGIILGIFVYYFIYKLIKIYNNCHKL